MVITGPQADLFRKDIQKNFLPFAVTLGTIHGSELPLLKERPVQPGKTAIYVCKDKVCQLPVYTPGATMAILQNPSI